MDANNIESRLILYYNGELSKDQIREVEAWISESEENRKLAEQVFYVCFASDSLDAKRTVDTAAALKKANARIRAIRFRKIMTGIQRAAAALLIPVAAIAGLLLARLNSDPVSVIEVSTTPGMVASVTLPDSSRVWLNSGSSLSYPSKFKKERRVRLEGEGYFDVTKDKTRKFIVDAQNTNVIVHGTQFNIDCYDSRSIRTTLISGSVDVSYLDSEKALCTARLQPSQQSLYDSVTGKMYILEGNTNCGSWKDGRIILSNTPLDEALRMIGNKYNVTFNIKNNGIRAYKFTGSFDDQSLEVILNHFAVSSDIQFTEIKDPGNAKGDFSGRTVYEVR